MRACIHTLLIKLAKALSIDPAGLFYREIDPETMRKNAEKAVIEDLSETFCSRIKDFVSEKIKKLDDQATVEDN